MLTDICITQNYKIFLDEINAHRNFYDKMNGKDAHSNVPGKDLTIKCHNGVYIGVNVGDKLTVGTLEQVNNMEKNISTEVAQGLIDQGWAEDVS